MSTNTRDTLFPKNTIIIITGNVCPIGWTLCDGVSGAPDLRGRSPFGINGGASAGYNVSLGDSSDTLVHNHTETHKHEVSTVLYHDSTSSVAEAGFSTHAYFHNHNVYVKTDASSVGTLSNESNLMAYYAVNFCIKMVN